MRSSVFFINLRLAPLAFGSAPFFFFLSLQDAFCDLFPVAACAFLAGYGYVH
jgi:hypothetical protein